MGEHQMVLISFRDYCRLKKNSDNYLHSKSVAKSSDNCKGHGAMEIQEASQLPNKEIPKQDIFQEKYANAVLEDSDSITTGGSSSGGEAGKIIPKIENVSKSGVVPVNCKANSEPDNRDAWYFIGIPKCMEKK